MFAHILLYQVMSTTLKLSIELIYSCPNFILGLLAEIFEWNSHLIPIWNYSYLKCRNDSFADCSCYKSAYFVKMFYCGDKNSKVVNASWQNSNKTRMCKKRKISLYSLSLCPFSKNNLICYVSSWPFSMHRYVCEYIRMYEYTDIHLHMYMYEYPHTCM